MTETTDTSAENTTQANECPVCGQEYTHKREDASANVSVVLRSDYRECRQEHNGPLSDHADVVYVHEPEERVVSHMKQAPSSGTSTLVDKILGGDA